MGQETWISTTKSTVNLWILKLNYPHWSSLLLFLVNCDSIFLVEKRGSMVCFDLEAGQHSWSLGSQTFSLNPWVWALNMWWIVICFLNNLVKYSSLNIKLKKSSTENPLKVLIGPLFATNGFTATGSRVEFQAASTSLPLFECAKILWVFGIFSWNCYVGFDSTTLLCDWCCISNPENSSLSLSNLNNAAIKKSRPWWLIIKMHQAKHFLGGFWWCLLLWKREKLDGFKALNASLFFMKIHDGLLALS